MATGRVGQRRGPRGSARAARRTSGRSTAGRFVELADRRPRSDRRSAPTVFCANTSGCAFASSTVLGSSGQPGDERREAGRPRTSSASGPSCSAAARARGRTRPASAPGGVRLGDLLGFVVTDVCHCVPSVDAAIRIPLSIASAPAHRQCVGTLNVPELPAAPSYLSAATSRCAVRRRGNGTTVASLLAARFGDFRRDGNATPNRACGSSGDTTTRPPPGTQRAATPTSRRKV